MVPISVIIPMYNAENYIEKCIASLQKQHYVNFEVVVVDDGSKDKSAEICFQLAQNDSRIRIIRQENGGVSAARNTGIQHATGEYVMFLDADDALDEQAFIELVPYINENFDVICWALKTARIQEPELYSMSEDCTLAYPGDEDKLRDLRLRTFSGWSQAGRKDQCMHLVVTKLIKRALILDNNLKFDTLLKHGEDTLFSIQVTEKAASIAALNRFYYIRTMHPDSATMSFCPTVGDNNQRYLLLLGEHIHRYHPDDERYQVALAKFQLSSFLLLVKLDCMHPNANYTNRIRKQKIKNACLSPVYLPEINIWNRAYKWKHRAVHLAIQFRASWLIQAAAKWGIL